MGFPADQDLEITLEAAWGADLTASPGTWDFTDLSSRLVQTPITYSHGVTVGNGTAKSASATGITLLNDDGQLTPHHPASQWWPYVDVGTPARLSIRTDTSAWLTDTFSRTVASGNWGTADSGQVWTPSTSASVSGGKGLLAPGITNAFYRVRTPFTRRDADVTFTVSLATASTGASTVIGPYLRGNSASTEYIWAGLEFDPGGGMRWTIREFVASVGTIRQQVAQPGVVYAGGTDVSCRVSLTGDRLRARAWLASDPEPSTWAADVHLPTLGDAASEYLGLQVLAALGNTNVLPNPFSVDNLAVQQPKYPKVEGYLTDVKPSFRQLPDGTTHSVVQISIGGIGSRLERRQADELSPMGRSIEKSAGPPIAYWRCEDKTGATSAASAFPGQPPLVPTGPIVFGFDLGITDDKLISDYGTGALCSLAAGAKLTGSVPVSSTSAWTVGMEHWSYVFGIGGGVTEVRLMEWATPGGTFQRWALVGTTGSYVVRAYNDLAGTVSTVLTFGAVIQLMAHYAVTATQNGSNIDVQFLGNDFILASGSVAGTHAPVTRVTINPDQVNTTNSTDPYGIKFVVGHVTVHDYLAQPLPFYYGTDATVLRADRAWAYEEAWRRVDRLARVEEKVPLTVLGDPASTGSQVLNAQQPGSFTTLLKQTVESDSGSLLLEGEFGYLLDSRTSRYHRPVALTVDMPTFCYPGGTDPTEILVPKLDARGPNIWTVERTNGSQATYAADAAFLARRGEVRDKATLDVLRDEDTVQHAAFRTHLSVDGQGANYPNMVLDLAANPDLIDQWLSCRVGSRVQRLNQPTIAGLGTIDQVIDGITETFSGTRSGGKAWTVTLDTSPAQVWDVGSYDGDYRYDSKTTTLASPVTSSATMLPLSVADRNDLWTTTTAPFDLVVEGQTNTVQWMSNPGSVATTEGGFETGISGWTPSGCTLAQSTSIVHAGAASLQMTVTGAPSVALAFNTVLWPVTPSVGHTAYGWLYAPVALATVQLRVYWYTAGGGLLSIVGSTAGPLSAGVWTQIVFPVPAGSVPGTAAQARVAPTITGSPAAGTVMYADDLDLVLDSASTAGTGPFVQKAFVTRDPIITKVLSAGSSVRVANPGRYGL